MAAPTHEKTWEISTDNLFPADNAYTERAGALRAIKDWLISGSRAVPLTVIGSSDGSTFGLDGVDRWDADGINTGAWIVLQDTGINAKFQICIHASVASAGAFTVAFVVSPVQGFGAANGGTNGGATTRPTATDSDTVQTITWGANSTPQAYRTYLWRSTDGATTRILFRNGSGGSWVTHWFWARPKAPAGGHPDQWTNPVYWSGGLNFLVPDSTLIRLSRAGAAPVTSGANTWTCVHGVIGTWNQVDLMRSGTTYPVFEIKLSADNATMKCPDLGSVWDAYTTPGTFAQGDRLPASGPKTWAVYVPGSSGQPGWALPHDDSVLKFGALP